MNRYDIINELIKKCDYKTYLEIGVKNPDECFNLISCETKHSVDPGYEDPENRVDYPYTSDNFFKLLENQELNLSTTHKWDIIFIDGLHISSQVEKDILNSLNHLSENGVIVLHDCNPPELRFAREDYMVDGYYVAWNGTVWKSIYKLRATRPDLFVCTVDTDWGIGIIRRGQQECCDFNNSFYEYREFEKNRKEHLNLISIEEFNNMLK
jgi:hypothetical protein